MFELYRQDGVTARLDANSQTSEMLGKVQVLPNQWTRTVGATSTWYECTVVLPAGTRFPMFGNTGGEVVALEYVQDYGTYKIMGLLASAAVSLYVYCFAGRNIKASNMGLQFLDIYGNVTFDAQSKWMRMAGVLNGAVFNTDYPLPSGVPVLAVGYSSKGNWIQWNNVGTQHPAFITLTYGIATTASTVKIGGIGRQGPPNEFPPPQTPRPPIGPIIFADVSGY
jgi:hypothetical protein